MKSGRPPMRRQFRRSLLSALASEPYPVTVASAKRLIDAQRPRPCGWHTIRKYLEELAAERLVLRQPLPAGDGRKPLVVYLGRSRDKP